MAEQLIHRGPDSAGTWSNAANNVGFGHRRLAIVDLTPAGHQPMTSADGRWTITYNGELYNAGTLRAKLGVTMGEMRGHSDTEVLVEAIARWGVDRTLEAAIGMFAFGAFDGHRDELWIARDRFGEKPLYYATTHRAFVFASELSALTVALDTQPEVDRMSVVELLERSAISAPHTVFCNVSKLEPGARARIRRDGTIDHARYYDPNAATSSTPDASRSDTDAIEELEMLLRQVVSERMIADVPLGAFLSGGVDSTLIVAMMQSLGGAKVQTFTMGFEDEALNEAPAARIIAAALGTEHREWTVSGSDALAVVPDLTRVYDEPFADSSQIPTILVSRFARQHVTVALSGDGGDELFGGYQRYQLFEQADRYRRLPTSVRRLGARSLRLLSEDTLDRIGASRAAALLPQPFRKRTGKRTHTAAALLAAAESLDVYDLITRPHRNGPRYVLGGARRERSPRLRELHALQPIAMAMAVDTIDYLPNDILTKVDRAAMSTSLETRAPLLDHRLHEFAWSLRSDQRVRDGVGKWIVRETVRRHVPEIADLPKRGFGVPLDQWLRGPLRQWAGDHLEPTHLKNAGVFDVDAIRRIWDRHQAGAADLGAELWPVLMFQSWSSR